MVNYQITKNFKRGKLRGFPINEIMPFESHNAAHRWHTGILSAYSNNQCEYLVSNFKQLAPNEKPTI
jgi:hypothetical protein